MGETVEFPSAGGDGTGYLALPPGGRGPGVVVVQEWWGLVHHITSVCDRFSEAGFVALAPDLFHGKTTTEPDEANKLLMAMDIGPAGREIVDAGRWLAASERTAGDRVGVVGFCAGAALAVYASSLSDVFAATVAFYPGFRLLDKVRPDFSSIGGAVLLHWADRDHSYDRASAAAFEIALSSAGFDVEGRWYPDTDHAFFNDDRPKVYNAEQAQVAWDRTLSFFRKHLAATPAPV